ncbi:hypothetical protein BRC62_00780 [Halobacteriales archaeon QH_10_67_13]|nr:MAG: hypothetical protein BRC62_00780 [Halobacteriales archaeon QH_10_67_13]
MSFKCSVFGHDFGPTETVREQTEEGNEVVTSVREVKTCSRCGKVRIVTENTEVTRVSPDPDSDPGPVAGPEPGPASASPGATAGEEQTATHDGGTVGRGASAGATGVDGADESETLSTLPDESTVPGVEHTSPEDDDGVILEDEGDERAPGEWPDTTDEEDEREHVSWPDDPRDGTATGDDPRENDTREDETESGAKAETTDDPESAAENAAEPTIEPTGGVATVPRGEFTCSACGHTESVESSSLRAGDFCPECRAGTLGHAPE